MSDVIWPRALVLTISRLLTLGFRKPEIRGSGRCDLRQPLPHRARFFVRVIDPVYCRFAAPNRLNSLGVTLKDRRAVAPPQGRA